MFRDEVMKQTCSILSTHYSTFYSKRKKVTHQRVLIVKFPIWDLKLSPNCKEKKIESDEKLEILICKKLTYKYLLYNDKNFVKW